MSLPMPADDFRTGEKGPNIPVQPDRQPYPGELPDDTVRGPQADGPADSEKAAADFGRSFDLDRDGGGTGAEPPGAPSGSGSGPTRDVAGETVAGARAQEADDSGAGVVDEDDPRVRDVLALARAVANPGSGPTADVAGKTVAGARAQEAGDSGVAVVDEDDPRVRDVLALARAVANLRQESLFNFGEMTGVKLTAILGEMLVHSELPDSYLETVRAVFAPPPGYEEVYRDFEERPGAVLVLLREPGAGQAFTAHALLADLRSRTGARVGPLSFGGTNRFPVRKLPLDQNCGYLLELPGDEGKEEGQDSDRFEIAAEFGATLTKIQYSLEKRSSRLVVLTTPEQWDRIKHGAPPNVVPTLGRPDPRAVAAAWLEAEAPQLDAELWLGHPEIGDLLKGQGPSEVLQIVTFILNANRGKDLAASTHPDEDEFISRVTRVVTARRDWRKDLRTWHSAPERTSFHRNFLLVAALFSNAPVAHIYAKASELSHALEGGESSLRGQQGPGVIEMIDVIQAELSDDDVIKFPKPGWDDAVLSYFWTDRPMAREPFLTWMAAAPVSRTTQFLETFTTDDRLLLANRVGAFAVRWAERHQKSEPLEEIAQKWCRDDALWPAAVSLVSAAALHPTLGRFIHEALLRWSKGHREGGMALQKLTVDVCAGEFGRLHTGKALRRLSHAAASPHKEVRTALHSAVRNLWSDPSVRQTLFDEVVSWCAKDPKRIQAGRQAFNALATLTTNEEPRRPVLLPTLQEGADSEPAVADLAKGWRTLLDPEADDEKTAEALNLWMDTAWQHPDQRETIFEVLRGAVDVPGRAGGSHPRHRLRDLLYRWQPVPAPDADPERVRLRHELADLLDHDRGLAVKQYRPAPAANGRAAER